jgi:hypothetical protein
MSEAVLPLLYKPLHIVQEQSYNHWHVLNNFKLNIIHLKCN